MQKIFLKITDYLDPAEISRNLENKDIEGILHDVEDTCINYDTPNDIDGAWPRADKTIAAGVTEDDFIFGLERPKEIVAFARNLLPQAHKDAKMCIESAMGDDPGLANARYLGTNVDVKSVLKNVADCILADGQASWKLSCAFRILNNEPTYWNSCLVYDKYGNWKGFLDDEELEKVFKHPDDYAVIPMLFD